MFGVCGEGPVRDVQRIQVARRGLKKSLRRDVSLARALSKLGVCSRTQAVELIALKRVSVNGRIVSDPALRCSLRDDDIALDGRTIKIKKFTYIMMNKPVGILTTRSDELGRTTVYDILGDIGEWVFPVGRLDKDTSGLLLLTNDNVLGERLTNVQSKVPKTYRVRLDSPLLPEHERLFRSGMMLAGKRLLPALLAKNVNPPQGLRGYWVELTIFEGKNRQVRRMCESLGYRVLELVRTKIGSYDLGELKAGKWKHLTKAEVKLLDRPRSESSPE